MSNIPKDIRTAVARVISDLKGRADSIEEDAEAVLADAFARAILAERNLHYDARWANKAVQDVKDEFSGAIWDIRSERQRQLDDEGWTAKRDDQYVNGELARAAASYAYEAARTDHQRELDKSEPPQLWPWGWNWWKPTNRRRDLIKAAALIVAEIERLDRAIIQKDKADD